MGTKSGLRLKAKLLLVKGMQRISGPPIMQSNKVRGLSRFVVLYYRLMKSYEGIAYPKTFIKCIYQKVLLC